MCMLADYRKILEEHIETVNVKFSEVVMSYKRELFLHIKPFSICFFLNYEFQLFRFKKTRKNEFSQAI